MKSLQEILTTILGQHEGAALHEPLSDTQRVTPRRLYARTLEDRILYSVTPMMLDEPPPPDIESVDADAIECEESTALNCEDIEADAVEAEEAVDFFTQEMVGEFDFGDGDGQLDGLVSFPAWEDGTPMEMDFGSASTQVGGVESVTPDTARSVEATLDGLEQLLTAEQHKESDALVVDDQVANEPHELAAVEIVLIDSRLEESEALAAAAKPGAIVLTFDSELDTADDILSRIGDWAESSHQRISSLSIVSHGAEGGFQFGKDFVTLETLSGTENAWRSLSEHLTEDADLAIYGCNVAASDAGQNLLLQLADWTGADVAGSDDLTGAADLGGDWEFEFFTSTPAEFTSQLFASAPAWNHTLATITVTTFTDENNGDTSSIAALQGNSGGAGISLREAIIAANNTAGDDTIILASGTYTLTISNSGGQEENSAQGDLDLNSNITITGAGIGLTTINGNSLDRVFDVNTNSTVSISDLKITGGYLSSGSNGSGLFVQATGAIVTLTRVDIDGNSGANGFAAAGVYNTGTLTVIDSLVRNNTTISNDGGGIVNTGTMSLTSVSVINNTATNGGGIRQTAGTSMLTNVTVSGNTSEYDGGGMQVTGGTVNVYYSTFAGNSSTSGNGGGILRSGGTVNVQSSIFGDNSSMYGGHDLHGAITSLGYNVIENYSGITTHGTDSLSTDAGLAALSQDATSGQYIHTLGGSSAALNKGGGTIPSSDIRGVARGATVDSGSYEANSAPVLSVAPAVTLNSVNEDAPVPAGAVGTLISSLIDFSGGGGLDNVTDTDVSASTGIAVTAASTTNGTWYYTTDGGANWLALGSVSGTTSRLLAADANTRIYFRPTTANYNGNIASAITFRAWDQSTGTNGSTANTSTNGGVSAFSANSDTASLTVNAVNDAPVLTLSGYAGLFTEGGAAIYDPGATVSDVDSTDFSGGQLSYSITSGGGNGDVLSIRNVGTGAGQIGVSGSNITYGGVVIGTWAGAGDASTPMVVTFNSSASVAAVQALARNVTYQNTGDNPGTSTRIFDITISDGDGGTCTPAVVNITMTAVNDAPVNSTPGAQAVNEDATLIFSSGNSNLVSISDLDANSSLMQVTLTGTNGAISLSTTSGLSFSSGDGTSDGSMTFTGTVTNINAALSGMSFTATSNYSGAASIQIVTNDQGNSGTGGPLSDTDTINITVNAVNDAPVNTIGSGWSMNEDATLPLTGLAIADVDASSGAMTVTLSVSNGSITATTGGGVTVSGTGTGLVTLTGTTTNINTFLSSVSRPVFSPQADFQGPVLLTMTTSDGGNTGSGGTLTDTDTALITVNAVADISNDSANTTEDNSVVIDVLGNDTFANSGKFISAVNGEAITANGPAVSVTGGTVALNGSGQLVFTPNADYNGSPSFSYTVSTFGAGALNYEFHDGTPSGLTIANIPTSGGTTGLINDFNVTSLSTSLTGSADGFGVRYTGSIYIATGGSYTFWTGSDDGSGVWIDGVQVVSNDGLHSFLETSADTSLTAGYHTIEIRFFENTGTETLTAHYSGADTSSVKTSLFDSASVGRMITETATVNLTVGAVNDAPTMTPGLVVNLAGTDENTTSSASSVSAILASSNWADVDSGAMSGMAITSTTGNGTWQYSTDGVSWQNVGAVSASNALLLTSASQVRYIPNGVDGETATFGYQAWDQTSGIASTNSTPNHADPGAGGGSTAFSSESGSASLAVSAVNDAPVNSVPTAQSMNEDSVLSFAAGNGNLISINDVDANSASVQVTLTGSNGLISLSGISGLSFITGDGAADSTMTFTGTVSSINAALNGLSFTTTTNYQGAASIQIVTNDLGNSGSGGALNDNDTIDITVNSVNDAPTGTDKTITTNEDAAYTLTTSDFGFGDAIDSPTNALTAVRITTIPAAGSLTLNGVSVTAGQAISIANINSGFLVWTPANNANGTSNTSFTFQVQDDGGTASGGVDLDQSANTITFNVDSVNDAPTGTDKTITTNEDTAYTLTASDFGFGDASDSPTNALAEVRIATIPDGGSLTLNGVAVTAGQSVSVENIDSGLLVWTPGGNTHGAANSSFTFQVQDSGGTANGGVDLDQTANTITFNVNSVNDAPIGTDKTITTNEDSAYTLTASDFGFGDSSDSPPNALMAVKITTIPSAGSLTLNGVAVTAGQSVSAANINSGLLTWTPAANVNGASNTTFTFQVQDDGGTSNGGIDLDQSANAITFNVNSVNDAPTGIDKTITTTEDTGYAFTAADFGFGDALDSSANSLAAVKISTLPGSGDLRLNGLAVLAGETVSIADINSGLLVWTPVGQTSGAGIASFTFQVQDNGGTANGGVDLDQSPNTITFDVNSVNDAPTGADKTITTDEDSAYTFTANDFGFGDANDAPANALAAVRVTTIPSAGSLTLSGATVTAGQVISVANINSGLLLWTPDLNVNGNNTTSFTFQVQDDGGTANGGVDLDPSANTITFNVNSINDAPTGTDKSITTNEDTAYTFTAIDFGFSDANDSPANMLSAVRITTTPGAGMLTLNGVAVTAGQTVSVANINGGLLVWTPTSNANGTSNASFTFQVQDDGGTTNGGVDLDQSANTITFNVSSVNDAPTGIDKIITTNEDADYVFTASDFGFGDAVDSPSNALLAVKISTLPGAGTLRLNGLSVMTGELVSVADINSGLLIWTPAGHSNGVGNSSFTFQVQDNGGTANGGVDLDQSANTITFNVNSVNDAPTGTDKTITTNEDTAYTLTAADFGFGDAFDSPANALTAVRITTIPGGGSLTLNGIAVSSGQTISAANISSGLLVWAPASNTNGASIASFTFQVQDNGGTANGGVDLDQSVNTITFNVNSVNDAPAGTDKTVTTNEDTDYVFAASHFGFGDANDAPANTLTAVKISTLPGSGTLRLNGLAVMAGEFVSLADINSGLLAWTPAANVHGAGNASFTFQVQDDGGTVSGGVNLDPTANTITLNVNSVNDAPTGTDKSISFAEDTTYTLTATDFGFADANDSPAHALTAVRIATLPSAGGLSLNGSAVTAGQMISAADINAGLLVFAPVTDGNGAGYSSFTFQVQDSGGTANGGVDLDASVNTITFDVSGVNDAPTANVPLAQMTPTNVPLTFSSGNGNLISIADIDSASSAVQVQLSVGDGVLNLSGASGLSFVSGANGSGAMTISGTVADINAALAGMSYTPDAGFGGAASLSIVVNDLGNNGSGGPLIDSETVAITVGTPGITVTPTSGLITSEGGAATGFTIVLTTRPTADVTISLSSSDLLEGILSASSVTFTAANWNLAQTINVYGVNDFVDDGDIAYSIITGSAVSADGDYSGMDATNLSVTNQDDDTAGFTVTPISGPVNEIGGQAFFTVVLNSQPTADVTLNLLSTDTSEGSINLNSLIFTAANWNLAQTVTITGLQDFINDGDIAFSIVLTSATSADGNYQGIDLTDVAVVNLEMPNQAPVNQLPSSSTVNEDTPLTLAGTQAISISDSDAGGNLLQVSLTSTNGVFSLSRTTGLNFSLGDGLDDSGMQFQGSIADINAALDGLVFLAAPEFNGIAQLSMATNDLGNSGSGGAQSDTDVLMIVVMPVNDRPFGSADTFQALNTQPRIISAMELLANDGDIDSAGLTVVLISQPQFGVVIQAADGSLIYLPDLVNRENVTFQYAVFDGAALSDPITVTIQPEVLAPLATTSAARVSDLPSEVRNLGATGSSDGMMSDDNSWNALRTSALEEARANSGTEFTKAFDNELEGVAANLQDDDSDTGVWIDESRIESEQWFSILSGVLNRPSGTGALAALDSMNRQFHAVDLTTMEAMFDRMRLDIHKTELPEHFGVGVVSVGTATLTAGYVFWALRGAQVAAMLLSATPTWASFDLLPVLAGGLLKKRSNEDDESLSEIASEAPIARESLA